jgi:prevent-host-death family protein
MNIPAAIFKAQCLKLMDEVARTGRPIVITKHGRAVAQLAPMPAQAESMFGYMKDTVRIKGDIMAPIDVKWSAVSGDEDPLYEVTPEKPRSRRRSAKK